MLIQKLIIGDTMEKLIIEDNMSTEKRDIITELKDDKFIIEDNMSSEKRDIITELKDDKILGESGRCFSFLPVPEIEEDDISPLVKALYYLSDNIELITKSVEETEDINLKDMENALRKDKKNKGNLLGLILSSGPGKTFKEFKELDENFSSWLKEYFENEFNK